MAAPYKLMEIQYSTETLFAENAESPASNTWQKRIPCTSYTLTTSQERIRDGGLLARMNDESLSHMGPREAQLEITALLPGHMTTTAGALTESWIQSLLKNGLGGGLTAASGTTVSGATTPSSVTFTSNAGWVAGCIGRIGAKGDARGNGQAFVVGTVAAPMTFLTAVDATPNNADVVYGTQLAYHDESVAQTLTTMRFLVGYASSPTTGGQYHLMGGQLTGIRLTFPLNANAMPEITLTYRFAYWARSAVTIPSSSLSLENMYAGPVSGGSFFVQSTGTVTRALQQPAQMDLQVELGTEPIYGPGGAGSYQQIVGWARTGVKPTLTFAVPFTTSWETWWETVNTSIVKRHILFTSNPFDGRCFGFYLPNVFPVGQKPSQPIEVNGQLYVNIMVVGAEGPTTTTELTRSAVRIFMG